MSRITKKRALLTAAITSLALVAVAIAFYSTAGTGSGSGSTATAYPNDLAILGSVITDDAGKLVPGGTVGIAGTIENTNTGAAKVSNLAGSVDAPTGCTDSWFTIDNVDIDDTDNVIDAGQTVNFTADLSMEDAYDTSTDPDTPINQDGCKNQTLDITWSSDLGTP